MTDIALAPPLTSPPGMISADADPVGWSHFPKFAKAALKRLRREHDDAWRAWRSVADERQETWNTKQAVEARLKGLTGGRADSAWYGGVQHARYQKLEDDDPRVLAENEKLKDLIDDLSRINELLAERSHRSQQLNSLVRSVETYLNGLGSVGATKLHKGPAPVTQKREAPVDAVERCRRRLRELEADRHRIASAPWHSTEAKQRARAEIDTLAERGEPSVLPLIESQEGIYWPERACTDVVVGGRLISSFGDPNGLPLFFWLNREAITEKIERLIDEVADDNSALTKQNRAERIAEIDRDRLATQRDEEFFIGRAITDGMTVLRRADADPRAVLGLADEMPPPKSSG